ncbi:hypothetical protein DFH09DRAFT_1146663 [Mycena vulgaris]|nr:hypothetical protein DFH09DRAFT_1146663 [Mycena vulgaris]
MSSSMFYTAHVLQLPDGVRNWSEYALALSDSEPGYDWENNEEQRARNDFVNDRAYMGTRSRFLLRLVREKGSFPLICSKSSTQKAEQPTSLLSFQTVATSVTAVWVQI